MIEATPEPWDGFDLGYVARLLGRKPQVARTRWTETAGCRGLSNGVYLADEPLPATDRARCLGCPVRTECLVEGLRPGIARLLPESPEELSFHFGGLGPVERWELLEEVRAYAARTGVTLPESVSVRGAEIVALLDAGRTPAEAASEFGIDADGARREVVRFLDAEGMSNRAIAECLGDVSYKKVERMRRALRSEAPREQEDGQWAA